MTRLIGMTPLTTTLRNGVTVLAKLYHNEPCAVTYANRTQATQKVTELGDGWAIYRGMGRPFFVARRDTLTSTASEATMNGDSVKN